MTVKCNIIADSCCDLPKSYLEANDVQVLHFAYAETGKSGGGLSGVDDMFETRSAHEFYEAIRNGAEPMTSQITPAEFDRLFRPAVESGVPTVYLGLSRGISGTYDGALAAVQRLRDEYGPDIPLYVADTGVASTVLTLYIVEAINRRNQGYTAEELVRWAENARYTAQIIFMVDDLHALRRGGRIPAGVATVGSLLDVKPLLTFDFDGKLEMAGMARGRKKGIKKFIELFRKTHDAGDSEDVVALGNADCPEDMLALKELLRAEPGGQNVRFVESNVGPTIGCHVGPGMMSCVFWGTDRRIGK